MAPLTGFTDRTITVSGLRLNTRRRHGTGTPLLLLHGLGGSLESWEPLLAALPDRDVVMIDAPGAGQSAVPLIPLRIWQIADRMVAAAEQLGVEQADVLGFSLGGTVAQEVARRHPAFARRLVLVGTMLGVGGRPPKRRAAVALLSTKRHHSRAAAEKDLPIVAGGRIARDPDKLAELLDAREAHPPTQRGYRLQQWAVIGWTSWPWLPRLDLPALVIQGEQDQAVPEKNGRLLAGRIPGARLEVVDGAGHMLMFDETERVAPIIEEFLS